MTHVIWLGLGTIVLFAGVPIGLYELLCHFWPNGTFKR